MLERSVRRSFRIGQLKRLRRDRAPRWVIRGAQVGLVLVRENLRVNGLGKRWSKRQAELYARFVQPELERAGDGE